MRKISKRIINKFGIFSPADRQQYADRLESEANNVDKIYLQMFERDIYLHISEISVVMLGVCLTGVSILNLAIDEIIGNRLNLGA